MHLRITAGLIPLSILFITTEKSDGLPRKSSSRKSGANQKTPEQNSVQKQSSEFLASTQSVQPPGTRNNSSEYNRIEQTQTLSSPDEFKPAETASERNAKASTSGSMSKEFSVPSQERSDDTRLKKTFAQALMTNISKRNDRSKEKVVQKKDPTLQSTPEGDEQWSPSKSYPKATNQGVTSTLPFFLDLEDSSSKKEEERPNIEKPVTTEELKEGRTRTGDEGKGKSVAPVSQMGGQGKNEKGKELEYVDRLRNISAYENIRFGSFDMVDYETSYKAKKDGHTMNDQPEENQSVQSHHVETRNEVNGEVMVGEGNSFINALSLSRSGTIDSEVFEIDLNKGKAVALDSGPTESSEIVDSNLTQIEEIRNNNAKKNESSGESNEPYVDRIFETVDRQKTVVDNTAAEQLEEEDKCSFLEKALDKQILLVVPNQTNFNVFAELHASNINLGDFDLVFKKAYPMSGAVLFKCSSEEETKRLCNAIVECENLHVKPKIEPREYVVRIYNIPHETTKEELLYTLHIEYGEIPNKIDIINRACSVGRELCYERVAIMRVDRLLWKKIRSCPIIRIRWIPYEIDATFQVLRCSRCHLLGHRQENCGLPPRLARPPPASWSYRCLDCSYHNAQCNDRQYRVNRNHPTNAEDCPTKIAYLKSLRRFRKPKTQRGGNSTT